MKMPKKVTVRDEPEGPVFTYALHNWGFSIIFLFGLVFTIFPLIVFFQTLGELIVSLFMLLFTAGGLALAYWSLVMMINRSEIRLQNGVLSVRHKPLPWKRPADIPVNEILALSQQTYYNRGQSMAGSGGLGVSVGTSIRNEKLVAIVSARNGQKKAVTLIPMMEYAAAQFLEGQIETRLGLRQAMSHTEQEMAVEFAQIEEKRILAAQGKGFIFLFILMAVGCLVGGAWWLVSLWSQQVEARASQAWPSTVGVSTAYWITRHEPDSDDNWDTYYTASIEYTYIVNRKAHTVEQFLPEQFDTERELEQYVETYYPKGTELTLYYNPQKPARALIDRSGPDSVAYILAVVLIVCGIVMALVVVWMAKEIGKSEGDPQAWKRWEFWREQIPFLGKPGQGSTNQ